MTAKRTVMTGKWDGCDNKGDGDDSLFIMLGTVMTTKETVMTACYMGDGHDSSRTVMITSNN